jgi:uncharacterized iron-regulated membrane protein
MKRAILIILTTMILFFFGLITLITEKYWAKADEELMFSDADSEELILSVDEQALIDRVLLRYKWDDVVQGTTTVRMTAHVE